MTLKLRSLLANAQEHPLRSWGPEEPNLIYALITIASDGETAPLVAIEALNEAKRLMAIELDGTDLGKTPMMKLSLRARLALEAWSVAQSQSRRKACVNREAQ